MRGSKSTCGKFKAGLAFYTLPSTTKPKNFKILDDRRFNRQLNNTVGKKFKKDIKIAVQTLNLTISSVAISFHPLTENNRIRMCRSR